MALERQLLNWPPVKPTEEMRAARYGLIGWPINLWLEFGLIVVLLVVVQPLACAGSRECVSTNRLFSAHAKMAGYLNLCILYNFSTN